MWWRGGTRCAVNIPGERALRRRSDRHTGARGGTGQGRAWCNAGRRSGARYGLLRQRTRGWWGWRRRTRRRRRRQRLARPGKNLARTRHGGWNRSRGRWCGPRRGGRRWCGGWWYDGWWCGGCGRSHGRSSGPAHAERWMNRRTAAKKRRAQRNGAWLIRIGLFRLFRGVLCRSRSRGLFHSGVRFDGRSSGRGGRVRSRPFRLFRDWRWRFGRRGRLRHADRDRFAAIIAPQLFGGVLFNRAGVGDVFGDAEFVQFIDDFARFYFQLARQYIDSNLTHIVEAFRFYCLPLPVASC